MSTTDIVLTSDADLLISVLYCEYIRRKTLGVAPSDARIFGGSDYVSTDLVPEWDMDSVDDAARSLAAHSLLNPFWADNHMDQAELTVSGVAYMEHAPERMMENILNRIVQLKKIIFFPL